MAAERWATGIAGVDRLLGGGLETDSLTEIYGEGGTAKTLFCLVAACRAARAGHWVFYVDTEGVSTDRLAATAGADLPAILGRLLLSSPKNLEEQGRAVSTACALARERQRPVGLIVLDSATNYYRLARSETDEDLAREALAGQIAELVGNALATGIPTLVTNQVWRNMRDGQIEPLGGSFLNHAAKTILRFERASGDRRRAVLVKHRSLPEGSAEFRITGTGLE